MPDGVTVERVDSILKAIDALKMQVSSQDWQQANTLRLIGELAAVVRDLAAGGTEQAIAASAGRPPNRKGEVDKLLWMAVKALPPGTDPQRRDQLVRHALKEWHVSEQEMAALGYGSTA